MEDAEKLEKDFVYVVKNAMNICKKWIDEGHSDVIAAKDAVDMLARISPFLKVLMRMEEFTKISKNAEELLKQQKLEHNEMPDNKATFDIHLGGDSKATFVLQNSLNIKIKKGN